MNARSIGLCFAAVVTVASANPESVVRFANDDLLTGSITSIRDDGILEWNSAAFEEPASFHLDKVLDITLPAASPPPEGDHEAVVTLTRGDVVRGRLASVNEDNVALETWFAGRLEFNRLMVAGVRIEERASALYHGPTGLDGWIQAGESAAWTYERMGLVSRGMGGIARGDLLPDECVISFDLAWKADSLNFKLILFSEDPTRDSPESGYELSFQRGSIYLRNSKTQGFIDSTYSRALVEQDRVSIELRASRLTGKMLLSIDSTVVMVWNDADVGRGRFGKALHFIPQNPSPLRVSRIVVGPWDGVIQDMPQPPMGMLRQFGMRRNNGAPSPASPPAVPDGRMELSNGDTIEGEISTIQDGVISLTTPLGDLSLPVSRFKTIALPEVDAEESIRRNGDVKAWFPDGGFIVFRLVSFDGETVTGHSQNFGTASFRLGAFSRIEFNIYHPDYEDKRAAEEW